MVALDVFKDFDFGGVGEVIFGFVALNFIALDLVASDLITGNVDGVPGTPDGRGVSGWAVMMDRI